MINRKSNILFYTLILVLLAWQLLLPQSAAETDSTFWKLTLPEIENYQRYYADELLKLQEERSTLIQRGIEDGERLLSLQARPEMEDEILIRLADLYYYDDKNTYLEKMEAYDRAVESGNADQTGGLPELPRKNYDRSLGLYKRLINNYTQSELLDDAVYNTGFLYEELERFEDAIRVYNRLITAFPKSPYVPEAYMRIGEYYFNPAVNDLPKAIEYYKKILVYVNSNRSSEALYKLGWSYYKLSEYPEAISYFTTLIDRLWNRPRGESGVLLLEEALDYMAICFVDFGGASRAGTYLASNNKPDWGLTVLIKLGDIYKNEKEAFPNGIEAYRAALAYTPYSARFPVVHQKLIDCYAAMGAEKELFNERTTFYETYQVGGQWWRITDEDEIKLQAYQLSENALRANISMAIRRVEKTKLRSSYENIAGLMQQYLEWFPEDLHAYMIRWNLALILDTILRKYEEALKEYLTISIVYNYDRYKVFAGEQGLASIRDAAGNAIVVADSLVQIEKRSASRKNKKWAYSTELANPESLRPDSLSDAERWLIMAYDNYVKLFPQDQKTPVILNNAGAVYYSHNYFDEALRYYKTLMQYFPDSPEAQTVQYSILESYFGKNDYQSTEYLAKKILATDLPDSIKSKAERRMGEAIFLKAEVLSQKGDAKMAASEYHRMALEVPNSKFADRSLFNASREYEKVKDYEAAIRTYEIIRTSYPSTSFMADVLNNVAFDYGETGNFQKAAERYEAYANLMRGRPEAQRGLFNAHLFYVKAKNWNQSIETGNQYILDYPRDRDREAIMFSLGKYYLNNRDTTNALDSYARYAAGYDTSAKSVEAFYRMGALNEKIGHSAAAREKYFDAFTRYQTLIQKGLRGDAFHASEGLFLSSKILHDDYRAIDFHLPESAIKASVKEKEALLRQLLRQYTDVVAFQDGRLPESLYRIGELYENYGRLWAQQEIPKLDVARTAVLEKQIFEEASTIYDQSIGRYKSAVSVLTRLLAEQRQIKHPDSLENAKQDSLIIVTSEWLQKSREKISENLYQVAEFNSAIVARLLSVPVPDDLKLEKRLEYQSQLLQKGIAPVLDQVVRAHQYHLHVADSLALDTVWKDSSKTKIADAACLIGESFQRLTREAALLYSNAFEAFRKSFAKTSDLDLGNRTLTLIELNQGYMNKTVQSYEDAFKIMHQAQVADSIMQVKRNHLLRYTVNMSDSLARWTRESQWGIVLSTQSLEETQDIIYEDMLAIYEDNVYFLKSLNADFTGRVFDIESAMQPCALTKSLELRLLKIDPEMYGPKVTLKMDTLIAGSDSTWQYAVSAQAGWEKPGFKAADWLVPEVKNTFEPEWQGAFALSRKDTLAPDSAVFIRKEIAIPGTPLQGILRLKGDAPVTAFWNGTRMTEGEEGLIDLTFLLNTGTNTLAVHYQHNNQLALKGLIRVYYLPIQEVPKE